MASVGTQIKQVAPASGGSLRYIMNFKTPIHSATKQLKEEPCGLLETKEREGVQGGRETRIMKMWWRTSREEGSGGGGVEVREEGEEVMRF